MILSLYNISIYILNINRGIKSNFIGFFKEKRCQKFFRNHNRQFYPLLYLLIEPLNFVSEYFNVSIFSYLNPKFSISFLNFE